MGSLLRASQLSKIKLKKHWIMVQEPFTKRKGWVRSKGLQTAKLLISGVWCHNAVIPADERIRGFKKSLHSIKIFIKKTHNDNQRIKTGVEMILSYYNSVPFTDHQLAARGPYLVSEFLPSGLQSLKLWINPIQSDAGVTQLKTYDSSLSVNQNFQ